jgi:hypothetical protein
MLVAKDVCLLAVGLPCLLIGPLALGSIYWVLGLIWLHDAFLPWTWFFWGATAVLVPLLFRLEKRTRGRYLADVIVGTEGASPMPYALGPDWGMAVSFIVHPRISSAGLVEVFLFGPRLVLDACEGLNRWRGLRHVDLARSAAMLERMRSSQQGVPPDQLLEPREKLVDIMPVLSFLMYYQWIDVSKTGERVWVLSDARRILWGDEPSLS